MPVAPKKKNPMVVKPVRFRDNQIDLIQQAANLDDADFGEFVRDAAVEKAKRRLKRVGE